MSFIIASEHGAIPTKELVENAIATNPHGWGLMYPRVKALAIVKGFNQDTLLEHLDKIKGQPYVLHFRKTYEPKSICMESIEPTEVIKGVWIAYDGMVRNCEALDPDKTPVQNFALNLAKFMAEFPEWCNTGSFAGYIGRWIGKDALAAVMYAGTNKIVLVNPSLWFLYNDMMLSDDECTPEAIERDYQERLSVLARPVKAKAATIEVKSASAVPLQQNPAHFGKGIRKIVYAALNSLIKCEWCHKPQSSLTEVDTERLCPECVILSDYAEQHGNASTDTVIEAPEDGTVINYADKKECDICKIELNRLVWFEGIRICEYCHTSAVAAMPTQDKHNEQYTPSWQKGSDDVAGHIY